MVEKVYREERNSYWYPELVPETKRWAIMGLTTAVPRAFFWSGDAKDGSSAAALAKVKLKQLQKEYVTSACESLLLLFRNSWPWFLVI